MLERSSISLDSTHSMDLASVGIRQWNLLLVNQSLPFLRAIAERFARFSHRPGVCLCLSVTPLSLIKTVQARITKSLLWAAPNKSSFRDKISWPWVQRFPSNEGIKDGYPLKRYYFVTIGSSTVNTVADRYKHVAYHNKHWWKAF